MYARHVTVKGDPGKVDEVLRTQQNVVLPVLRDCIGFKAQLLLLDRAKGEAIGISLWDTEENMNASEERVKAARQQVADSLEADTPPKVRLYELPIFEQAE
jgi:hypothetical protein